MSKDLPDPDDREIIQLMAAQQTVMDHTELHEEYKENIRQFARMYGVDHRLLE